MVDTPAIECTAQWVKNWRDVLLRRWPDLSERARAIDRDEAMRTLLLTYLHNVGVTTLESVVHLFGWEKSRLTMICAELAGNGELLTGVHVKGWPGEYLAWPAFV